MANFSNTKDILNYFESITGDTPDQTTELNFANEAKDLIEEDRNWNFLKKEDSSQSVVAGDTYLTAKTLPSDFRYPLDSGIYVGSDVLSYQQLPFEDRRNFQDNVSHRYYIDEANSNFFICGKPPAGTIFFPYMKTTPFLDLASSNPLFPARFWPMIACKMAMLWYAYDQGMKARAWDDRWQIEYEQLKSAMVRWDERRQRASYQNRQEQRYDSRSLPLVLDI